MRAWKDELKWWLVIALMWLYKSVYRSVRGLVPYVIRHKVGHYWHVMKKGLGDLKKAWNAEEEKRDLLWAFFYIFLLSLLGVASLLIPTEGVPSYFYIGTGSRSLVTLYLIPVIWSSIQVLAKTWILSKFIKRRLSKRVFRCLLRKVKSNPSQRKFYLGTLRQIRYANGNGLKKKKIPVWESLCFHYRGASFKGHYLLAVLGAMVFLTQISIFICVRRKYWFGLVPTLVGEYVRVLVVGILSPYMFHVYDFVFSHNFVVAFFVFALLGGLAETFVGSLFHLIAKVRMWRPRRYPVLGGYAGAISMSLSGCLGVVIWFVMNLL